MVGGGGGGGLETKMSFWAIFILIVDLIPFPLSLSFLHFQIICSIEGP